ncbi:hypothetical protein MNBD_GAMMA04-431 [hydrothermal vent metagenome]|uniref:Uncharacterized protein n=1 Tax=hydrothermal vent metagenome TaxID=652676 RepID=A0A3B0WDJ4_9ZZZZ
MPNTSFSNALFEQMGGVNWQIRPNSVLNTADATVQDSAVTKTATEEVFVLETHERETTPDARTVVVLGQGLDDVWQNESQQAWLLWQNIVQVFDWEDAQIVFFDTAHLASEEVNFTTMEEIIELGVDWVLSMDEEHALSEMLQEGVQVVQVPDLESMLMDPYAKQVFYNTVVSTTELLPAHS